MFGDLKNSYFSYFRHFYNRSVMADPLRIFNFLENNFHEIHFNHIIDMYILAFMHIHRFNSFKRFRKRILNLFFPIFSIFVPFSVSAITFHEICAENILFSKEEVLFEYHDIVKPNIYKTKRISRSKIVYLKPNCVGHYIINFSKNWMFCKI